MSSDTGSLSERSGYHTSLDALKPAALSGLRFAVVNVDTTLPWPLDQRRVERRMRGMGTDTGWSARAGRSVRTEGERA